jgi:hypothetical protein
MLVCEALPTSHRWALTKPEKTRDSQLGTPLPRVEVSGGVSKLVESGGTTSLGSKCFSWGSHEMELLTTCERSLTRR